MGNASNKMKKHKSTLLSSNDLKGIAEYIKSGKCKKIAICAGAGISVSAGIPDFRSTDGFYNTLNTNDFPMLTEEQIKEIEIDKDHILTIELFEENPSVYLHARKEFILSGFKYKPTLTHWFFKLLEEKGLLKRFYSTNIDGLDVATNISKDILIHVHGTCGNAICYQCKKEFDKDKLKELLENDQHLKQNLKCDKCNKPKNWIKPNTVLFGESLPGIFFELLENQKDLDDVDLLIIAGTSLSVYPSNGIPGYVNQDKCVRLLTNRELPYLFKINKNDVFYKGNCDDAFEELSQLLGWTEDLQKLIDNYQKSKTDNDNNNDNDNNDEDEEKKDDK